MVRLVAMFSACFVCLALGCGRTSRHPRRVSAPPSVAKPLLEDLAKTGEMGSAVGAIPEALEGMKQTDAAKAEKLLKELDQIQALSNPEQIKAKAKAMASQL